jgi:hypothetical protein
LLLQLLLEAILLCTTVRKVIIEHILGVLFFLFRWLLGIMLYLLLGLKKIGDDVLAVLYHFILGCKDESYLEITR